MQTAQHLHRFIQSTAKDNPSIAKKQSHCSCVAPPVVNSTSKLKLLAWIVAMQPLFSQLVEVWAPPAKRFTPLGFYLLLPAHSASRGLGGFNVTSGTQSKLWGHAASPFTKALQCLQGNKLLSLCNKSSNCLFFLSVSGSCIHSLSGPCWRPRSDLFVGTIKGIQSWCHFSEWCWVTEAANHSSWLGDWAAVGNLRPHSRDAGQQRPLLDALHHTPSIKVSIVCWEFIQSV